MLIIFLLILFFSVYFTEKFLKKLINEQNPFFYSKDMNKKKEPLIFRIGGIAPFFSLSISLILFFFYCYLFSIPYDLLFFPTFITFVFFGVIGILDDLFKLSQGFRALIPSIAAFLFVPFVITNMHLPIVGWIELGVIYFFLLALGLTGAPNALNMYAGFNGLEAGTVLIILFFFLIFSFLTDQVFWFYLILISIFSIIPFYLKNKYPAKVFPGNVFTYAFGGLIAAIAIGMKIEFYATIMFLPMFLDLFLQAKGKFKKNVFGKEQKDGSLVPRYGVYHLANLLMVLNKVDEKKLVLEMHLLLIISSILALVLFLFF